jgi:hypothetical protein
MDDLNNAGEQVAIIRLIDELGATDLSFDERSSLIAAYESALLALGITERDEGMSALLAKKIIAASKSGERDPHRLRDIAIASLGNLR